MAAEVSSFAFTSDYSVDMLHLFVWCDLAWTGGNMLHRAPSVHWHLINLLFTDLLYNLYVNHHQTVKRNPHNYPELQATSFSYFLFPNKYPDNQLKYHRTETLYTLTLGRLKSINILYFFLRGTEKGNR